MKYDRIFERNKLESSVDFLKTGLAATVIAFFLGIFCARKIMKLKPGARAVLDGILTLPLVLPPTVAGFFCY